MSEKKEKKPKWKKLLAHVEIDGVLVLRVDVERGDSLTTGKSLVSWDNLPLVASILVAAGSAIAETAAKRVSRRRAPPEPEDPPPSP